MGERREQVARIIDPDAWRLYDNANAMTKMNREVSEWRIFPSLEKADVILGATETRCAAVSNPEDCGWPFCSCDPVANRVLEAIGECGLVIVPQIPTAKMIAAAGGEQINLERADDQSYRPADVWVEMIEAAR